MWKRYLRIWGPPDVLKSAILVVILAVVWSGFALLGGYIAGRMGKEDPALNGKWVGGIVGGILLLFTLLQLLLALGAGNLSKEFLSVFMGLAQVAAIFFLAMLGGRLAGRGGGEEA